MAVSWLAPMALLGVALVAIPIAIHLLVRQQSRRVEFPSLRFLLPSQLAAFRRRNIQDAWLLACRAAIVAVAALALAGPVLQTASRSAGYGARTARAVIVEPGIEPPSAIKLAGDAFVSKSFARERVGDAIADATRWLDVQPPASRELVFVGAFRRGSVAAGDLRGIGPTVGIRFVAAGGMLNGREAQLSIVRSGPAGLVFEQRQVRFEDDRTQVTAGGTTAADGDLVRIVAAPADQPLADAALRVALAEGLRWRDPARRVLVAWTGADEATVQRAVAGATLVRMPRPDPPATAASAIVVAVERVTAAPTDVMEPVGISPEQLQSWSRPPSGVPASAPATDEGDRRWLWALALGLLGLEHFLRRSKSVEVAAEPVSGARVA